LIVEAGGTFIFEGLIISKEDKRQENNSKFGLRCLMNRIRGSSCGSCLSGMG
jgi:hypothetical protein